MLNIVIVDDEEYVLKGLEIIISEAGRNYCVVGCFEDGEDALPKLLSLDVDVILTDIKMPRMDGLELIKNVKMLNTEITCVILSGFDDFEYARVALRYGVKDFLLKPVDENELFRCFDEIAKSKNKADRDISEGEKRTVTIVKKIIDTEYYKEFTLAYLAEKVYLNPKYLSRLFKDETGITITDYLLHTRIAKAKELLIGNLDMKIYEIAGAVGYEEPDFFNKLFKRAVGISPRDYRLKYSKNT